MPFVTEGTFVYLIIGIFSEEQSSIIRFLTHSNRTIFEKEKEEKLEIILIHITRSKQEYSQSEKWFEPIRETVNLIRQQRKEVRVHYETVLLHTELISRSLLNIELLEFFSEKLEANSFVFLTTPFVEIEGDFLNRCRLNVIEKVQVYFPIGFYQYHPEIIRQSFNLTNDSVVELHKAHGWFNSYAFEHVGLYLSDYLLLKEKLQPENVSIKEINLYDSFSKYTELHILRAPDQSLRVRFQPIQCSRSMQSNPTEFYRCSKQREKGLASRSQLAMFFIENQENL